MLFRNIVMVGFGGMIGSMLRYLVSHYVKHNSFPFATFTVNIVGSLVIGAIMGLTSRDEDFGNWRLFLASGICGGFTTFSAFAWENMQLLEQQRYAGFLLYSVLSLVLGLVAVGLGYWVTK